MALDGVLLNRIVTTMQEAVPLKINRITQASEHEFFFSIFNGNKMNLFISTHPQFARVQWTDSKPSTNLDQTHILMVLRKHFSGGIITEIKQFGFDRIVSIVVEHRDDMGVIQTNTIIIELIGRSANMILLNNENKILDATRRSGGFESTQRSIHPGSIYEMPEHFGKRPFTELADFNEDVFLRSQFEGISPVLEKEILHRLRNGQSIESILDETLSSKNLYVYPQDYHCLELTHLGISSKSYALHEGLDRFYSEIQAQARIKDHTGDLLRQVKRELKRSLKKLPKLESDLEAALDCEHLRLYGDILYTYGHAIKAGNSSYEGFDFEDNPVSIPLDSRFNGITNAQRYFKQYNKAKTSITYLNEQISTTQQQIDYLNTLIVQLQQANVEDAQEIATELMEAGIIKKTISKNKHTKKKKNNYIHINFDENTNIYIGKNNIQNDTITFKLGHKDDIWFHVANMPGAHVLLKTDHMDEEKQRLCCQLAAYFSAARHSSSVEVHYTQIKNIKKVPKGPLGLVSISTQKSMFIDPDEDYLLTYLKQ